MKLKISPINTDGSLLNDDEFLAQKRSIIAEKTKLEESLGNQGSRISNWAEQVEEHFNFALHARYRFENGTPDEKREMLVTVGSNLTLFNKILAVDLENEYAFLEYSKEVEPSVSEVFEPEKSIDVSVDFETLWAQNPLLLPLLDAFRNQEVENNYPLETLKSIFNTQAVSTYPQPS